MSKNNKKGQKWGEEDNNRFKGENQENDKKWKNLRKIYVNTLFLP